MPTQAYVCVLARFLYLIVESSTTADVERRPRTATLASSVIPTYGLVLLYRGPALHSRHASDDSIPLTPCGERLINSTARFFG